jgi:hypothetical protein
MNVPDTLLDRFPAGFFRRIEVSCLLGQPTEWVEVKQTGERFHVVLGFDLTEAGAQNDFFVLFDLDFQADFHWTPHLTPEPGFIIDQHVFRTPALIARGSGKTVVLLPDIETLASSPVRYYLDMDAPKRRLVLGMSESKVEGHVLYKKAEGAAYPAGRLEFGFHVFLYLEELENPFRAVLDFFWTRYGRSAFDATNASVSDLDRYVEHAYTWAFERWKDVVWQEFTMGGKPVGAPVFIVTTSQSPGYPGVQREREVRSIWNQAWFCSLRSASGLFRRARRTGNAEWMRLASMTKELALSFLQQDGLFDSVIVAGNGKGWENRFSGNSDRNPFEKSIAEAPRHILDMSFTAYYMLVWYEELEKDERLAEYALRYAERLTALQDPEGYFPAWVDENGKGKGVLDQSPESAMSAVFLFQCDRLFRREEFRHSALRAVAAIQKDIVPVGRWEDFETYWSCSRWWSDHVGEKIIRNDQFKSCNLSMYYTALALWNAHANTGELRFLNCGRRVLDELLMTQASYQPAFLPVPVLGGFGVLNADAEWNDARQSLFAELILQYGLALGEPEYVERAAAALRASFAMMYCPENPVMKALWEKAWPYLNEKDYGFMMENLGHDGRIDTHGCAIGEFTIYDWGNGAAAEGYERMKDHQDKESSDA